MNKYFINSNKIYSAPADIPGGSLNDKVKLTKSDCSVIYEIYDQLLKQHPQYITKTVLGNAFGYPINSYSIKNFKMQNFSPFQAKRVKICIITSIHGYEQGCAWTCAHFFKQMLTNPDDEILGFLLRNVDFEVVPVLNPWGFKNNDRKNGNKVDLNRNFPMGFTGLKDVEDEIYPGPEPLSETETKIITEFIEKHLDASLVLDYHNIYGGYPLFYVYSEKDVQLAQSVFTQLTDKWTKEYSQLPKDQILGLVRPNGNSGMFADYLLSKNLWVLTMETPWCMPVIAKEQYDSVTIKCALEVLVNTINTIVHSFL
ncbi:MAG: DUF2817 domain-containing protein [Clostridiales bacterium]|nr:DUF2817 domain-containing protein [Clostridiales bacterium]